MTTATKMTADGFAELDNPQGRLQLIDGEVVMTMAGRAHQRVAKDIRFALETWVRQAEGRGELSVPLASSQLPGFELAVADLF